MSEVKDKRPWGVQIKEEVARLKAENAQLKDDKETLLSAVSRHASEMGTLRQDNEKLAKLVKAKDEHMDSLKDRILKLSNDLETARKRWWHWFKWLAE